MSPTPRRSPFARRLGLCTVFVLALATIGSLAPSRVRAAVLIPGAETLDPPATVTADALPTVQVDGVVWDQVIVGDRVYATGDFAHARPAGAPPGTDETPRSNILAYDLHTGALIASWAPSLNAQGLALAASADGSTIYVGGDFAQVDGEWQSRIAALDAVTGELVPDWKPHANTRVSALVVDGDTLYVGGDFTILAQQPRLRLAALDADTGELLGWTPSADREVVTIVVHTASGRVIVGGSFTRLNGSAQSGMGALDAATGGVLPWAANTIIRNGGPSNAIAGLTTDGELIYGVGWVHYGGGANGTFEGVFAAHPATGELAWVNGCLGDRYDLALLGDVVYSVGHSHDCGMVDANPESSPRTWQYAEAADRRGSRHGMHNAHGPFARWHYFPGLPATDVLPWLPTFTAGSYTGSAQAGWTVEATDDYVVVGGEFPKVNGVPQQGLVRFARRDIAPNQEGPLRFDEVTPRLTALGPGSVRVEWTASWDRDDSTLTYELLRGPQAHSSEVLATWPLTSGRWDRPLLGFVDSSAPPGTAQTYRVRVTDPSGNGGPSTSRSIVIPTGEPTPSPYRDAVMTNGAVHHWRLGENSGGTGFDQARANDLSLWSNVQRGATGALLNEDDTATRWPGTTSTSTVQGAAELWEPGPQTFSMEAWINTSSTQGGKIVGFGNSRTGRSSSDVTDRHLYMTNDGQLRFGLRPDFGDRRTIESAPGYNDGEWHHVVATLDGTGARLYVDSELVAEDPTLTKAQVYWGHWRIAGDRLTGWPAAPSREAFAGTIDEVAIYPTALDVHQVRKSYAASGRDGGLPYALDDFERTTTGGFGAAPVGGPWTTQGPASSFSVGGGAGHIVVEAPGLTRSALLADVAASDVDVSATLSVDRESSGGGIYALLVARRISPDNEYRMQVRFMPSGQVMVNILRVQGASRPVLASTIVPDLAYGSGELLKARFSIEGHALRAKVWTGEDEPASWSAEAVDSTPELTGPGAVAIMHYVSGTTAPGPVVLSVAEFGADRQR